MSRFEIARGLLWLAMGLAVVRQFLPMWYGMSGWTMWGQAWSSGYQWLYQGFPHPAYLKTSAGIAGGTFCALAVPWFARTLIQNAWLHAGMLVMSIATLAVMMDAGIQEIGFLLRIYGSKIQMAAVVVNALGLAVLPWSWKEKPLEIREEVGR